MSPMATGALLSDSMSVTLEGDAGCSALGHLYRSEAGRRVCITCGHVQEPADGMQGDQATGGN